MRRALLLAAAALCIAAAPPGTDRLYEGRAIVTGTERATRLDGLAQALADVLVKLSGNPALLHDKRVETLAKSPEPLLDDFAYLDRMVDIPRHDEQGTRDRPFILIAHFNPARTDTVLTKLGEHPWLAPRPRVLMRVQIHDRKAGFPLTADGGDDERQRESLLTAADRMGLRVVLLPTAQLKAPTPKQPDLVELTGTLTWSDTAYGWVGDWHMTLHGKPITWGISGVSFDAAFRNAMRGALAALSGHKLVLPDE